MKHFRIGPHDPNIIHEQLRAAGVPVITVRSSRANREDESAMYGVVVVADHASDVQVEAMINAHVPAKPVPVRAARDIVAAQAKMENKKDVEIAAEVAAVDAAEIELSKEE